MNHWIWSVKYDMQLRPSCSTHFEWSVVFTSMVQRWDMTMRDFKAISEEFDADTICT